MKPFFLKTIQFPSEKYIKIFFNMISKFYVQVLSLYFANLQLIYFYNSFPDNANLHTSRDQEYERMVNYQTEWMKLDEQFDEHRIKLFHDVLSAHKFLEQLSNDEKLHILITGSLHLVGNFLTLLDPDLKFSS